MWRRSAEERIASKVTKVFQGKFKIQIQRYHVPSVISKVQNKQTN